MSIEERLLSYEEIRDRSATVYKSFGSVFSPTLKQKIYFTSEGFNHLIYSSPRKMRDKRAQILRFDMLERARKIIEISSTYQEYEEEIVNTRVNRNNHWVQRNVPVTRWGFVAIIDKYRVKVVLTKEGNGQIKFLSVAPAWITKKYRDIKLIEMSVGKGLSFIDDEEVLKNATYRM